MNYEQTQMTLQNGRELKRNPLPKDIRQWLKSEQKRLGIPYRELVISLKLREKMEAETISSNLGQ